MANVYVIENEQGKRYIGSTDDLPRRLSEHNRGQNASTRGKGTWRLIYFEEFCTLLEAKRRELEIKRKKRRAYVDWLIEKKKNHGRVV